MFDKVQLLLQDATDDELFVDDRGFGTRDGQKFLQLLGITGVGNYDGVKGPGGRLFR